jgi:hypothetical protein
MVRQTTPEERETLEKIRKNIEKYGHMSHWADFHANCDNIEDTRPEKIEKELEYLSQVFNDVKRMEIEYKDIMGIKLPDEHLKILKRLDGACMRIYSEHIKNKARRN